ncbi:hypothetical protein [Ehrlichia canis]|uniref:hypothetical protein n=1 Tax=Ehrlichia canis TaxID=944 RepID=UPI00131520F7|nr:hypothetical protein [Ehrlichia canis]UKC53889.1 hypothetical protein s20019040002_000934 [Ehrlichia canis]UKC54825.1 hypothetical protein s20026770001_000933 [Ehrlichia canis]UKC55761.1 hypothetical protein s21009500007_000933 [Ehrlichia canis]
MQLLLFCDRNNKLFLYDMSLCKEVNGKIVDTVLSLCEVLAPTHLTPKMIKLR